jgi:hypothetical protein
MLRILIVKLIVAKPNRGREPLEVLWAERVRVEKSAETARTVRKC